MFVKGESRHVFLHKISGLQPFFSSRIRVTSQMITNYCIRLRTYVLYIFRRRLTTHKKYFYLRVIRYTIEAKTLSRYYGIKSRAFRRMPITV